MDIRMPQLDALWTIAKGFKIPPSATPDNPTARSIIPGVDQRR